jgi:hypothetical protein
MVSKVKGKQVAVRIWICIKSQMARINVSRLDIPANANSMHLANPSRLVSLRNNSTQDQQYTANVAIC